MTIRHHPNDIIENARRFIGTPYRHQAACLGAGCDCLGLVRGVWRALYGEEPAVTSSYEPGWAIARGEETLRDAARIYLVEIAAHDFQPGDVLLFRWRRDLAARHLGIATSGLTMVHAHEGACVAEVSIGPWRKRIAYAFRFPSVYEGAAS